MLELFSMEISKENLVTLVLFCIYKLKTSGYCISGHYLFIFKTGLSCLVVFLMLPICSIYYCKSSIQYFVSLLILLEQ